MTEPDDIPFFVPHKYNPNFVGRITTYTYDTAGRLSTTTLPNGVQTTNSYDDAGRITSLRHVDANTGVLQAEYLYELDGLGNRQVATETLRLPDSGGGGLQTTFITYNYDPLYRLTGASHTGGITASYSYVYDSVGNMTAYTETVGAETSSVNRVFDDANQLLVATDIELGTTSFYYDGNGNLVQIMPPGASGQSLAGTLRYGYNQCNLLITNTFYISDTGWVEQATFTYDGDGNRVQQVDATGSQPVTTTYTNDNTGLSQVLVASTGITTTHYLMGLNLVSQDNGLETRILLADGLGSARTELVGNAIQTVTTFEPYGKMLAQTGDSGTVYGYTGEQYDSATSLVYLRARYYNPNLKMFMSRDPFPGYQTLPASQHPYSYVHNNPVNLTDPGGEQAEGGILSICLAQPELCVAAILLYVIAVNVATNNDIDINWPDIDWPCDPPTVTPDIGTRIPPGIEERNGRVEDIGPVIVRPEARSVPHPQPQPEPEEESTPPPPPPPDRPDPKVIVELGAGDYSNAITMKKANLNNHVIATNWLDDWELGKLASQQGRSPEDYYQVGFYQGWEKALLQGVDAGFPTPYENRDVPNGVADLVYTILPYPHTAGEFGFEAARIAKYQSGTKVAITAASRIVAEDFEFGFRRGRPGSGFIKYPGATYGEPGGHEPGRKWEPGPYNTWIYEVP